MRARIGTRSRRLAKAEAVALDNEGKLRGGVMLVPRIEYDNLNAWELRAMAQQLALALSAAEDIDRKRANDPTQFRHALPAEVPQHDGAHGYSLQTGVVAPVHRPKRPPLPPSTGLMR